MSEIGNCNIEMFWMLDAERYLFASNKLLPNFYPLVENKHVSPLRDVLILRQSSSSISGQDHLGCCPPFEGDSSNEVCSQTAISAQARDNGSVTRTHGCSRSPDWWSATTVLPMRIC